MRVGEPELEGLANFRDLGGIPLPDGRSIRPGVLFRSDSAAYATPADATLLVETLGLRTVVDLRDLPEIEAFGRGPLERAEVGYLNVPIGDVLHAMTRAEQYATMLETGGTALIEMLRRLGTNGFPPALIHCQIGCDRTGIVTAAILSLVGVADDEICTDYARSTRASGRIRERSRQRRTALGLPQMPDSYYDAWEPVASVMAEAIEVVGRRWGGFAGWALAYGFGPSDVAVLRSTLVA